MSRPSLIIAIDFDKTFTADPECQREVIKLYRAYGHQVICVSSRRNTLEHRLALEAALPEGVPILLAYDVPKREYARSQGYEVDIWMDDLPESIPTKRELEAMCG